MKTRLLLMFMLTLWCVLNMQMLLSAKELTPQDVYDQKQHALENLDCNEFCKYLAKENVAGFQQAKDQRQLMFLVKTTTAPIKYEFIGEDIKKNEAIVFLKGKKANPSLGGAVEDGFGKAFFKKEGNEWKFLKEEWQKEPWKR